MDLGMIGLGRMGGAMAQRLLAGGHRVVGYDPSPDALRDLQSHGGEPAASPEDVAARLKPPRAIWMMVPAGPAVQATIDRLLPCLSPGDVLVDGGNSNFKDSMARAARVREAGCYLLDVGTSGGIWGLEEGYCLMIGGEPAAFDLLEPAFKTLAPEQGYARVGSSGAGHFVKMVHNGIEYALLQAYGEGFELLESSAFGLDLRRIAALWQRGSVVRSWLLELAERAFGEDPHLAGIRGYVEDSGEGRWTVETALEQATPAPLITLSLMERFRSRQDDSFSAKVVAALRKQFGGHPVRPAG